MVSSATIGPSNSKDGSRQDSRASTHNDVSHVSETSAGVEMTRKIEISLFVFIYVFRASW